MSLFARRNNSERHRTLGKDNVKDVTSSSSNHRADNAFEAVHRLRKAVDHFFSPFSVPWGRYTCNVETASRWSAYLEP
jgi:hypothetical protein